MARLALLFLLDQVGEPCTKILRSDSRDGDIFGYVAVLFEASFTRVHSA